jgi:hypothetical protein
VALVRLLTVAAMLSACDDGVYDLANSESFGNEEPTASADSDTCQSASDCVVGEVCAFNRCAAAPPSVPAGTPLFFGAFGDCVASPTAEDPPTPIVSNIFRELAARQVQFITMVGDYLLVQPPSFSGALNQLATFSQARQLFAGPVYFALGNHDAATQNLTAYRQVMIREVYYAFIMQAAPRPGSTAPATAKFVFVADNAWSPDQSTWLQNVLGTQTDYTFVVRHHTSDTALDPEPTQIISTHPLTLLIVGHVHTYQRIADREVLSGNGGAPVYQGPYGYLTIQQQSDGRISVTAFDQSTDQPFDSFIVDP